jgi:hypothetical protein
MSEESETRDYHRSELDDARKKRSQLGAKSYVAAALTDDMLQEIDYRIETAWLPDLTYCYSPYVFGFVLQHDAETLADLDADIHLVLNHTNPLQKRSITTFLQTRDGRTGQWFSGLFEVWTKATFLKKGEQVQLDVPVGNGRNHDISAVVGGRRFHFECSVLTQDDEAVDVWKRFIEHKKLNPDQVLVRPGPFCPPNAKGPSPYYHSLRFYAKVYDKLTKNLDPAKGQFKEAEPNIMLTCFAGPGVPSEDPGIQWGLEELFNCHPRMARTVVPEPFTDISLEAWADFRARELIDQGKIKIEWYLENSHRVLEAPRCLGAMLLFDHSRFAAGRVNYNAARASALSHGEMAELEQLVMSPAKYFRDLRPY